MNGGGHRGQLLAGGITGRVNRGPVVRLAVDGGAFLVDILDTLGVAEDEQAVACLADGLVDLSRRMLIAASPYHQRLVEDGEYGVTSEAVGEKLKVGTHDLQRQRRTGKI